MKTFSWKTICLTVWSINLIELEKGAQAWVLGEYRTVRLSIEASWIKGTNPNHDQMLLFQGGKVKIASQLERQYQLNTQWEEVPRIWVATSAWNYNRLFRKVHWKKFSKMYSGVVSIISFHLPQFYFRSEHPQVRLLVLPGPRRLRYKKQTLQVHPLVYLYDSGTRMKAVTMCCKSGSHPRACLPPSRSVLVIRHYNAIWTSWHRVDGTMRDSA